MADSVDLAQACNSNLDQGSTPAGLRASEAQEALRA